MIMFGKMLPTFLRRSKAVLVAGCLAAASGALSAADPAVAGDSPAVTTTPLELQQTYRLSPNDLVRVKVFQEDDLTTEMRLGRDGSSTFPLLGVVNLAGKTVEEAAASLRDALGKDYLVNPQITLTVVEYAKRRFTVLGQVQKPGSYELPGEESVTLLQAIAMAGGFTRLAVQSKVTVTRTLGGKKTLVVDVKSNANDPSTKQFDIQPEDTIIVSERVF
jgi:protein involved in polysaccharide export with SLBB domain